MPGQGACLNYLPSLNECQLGYITLFTVSSQTDSKWAKRSGGDFLHRVICTNCCNTPMIVETAFYVLWFHDGFLLIVNILENFKINSLNDIIIIASSIIIIIIIIIFLEPSDLYWCFCLNIQSHLATCKNSSQISSLNDKLFLGAYLQELLLHIIHFILCWNTQCYHFIISVPCIFPQSCLIWYSLA